jgi:hypothetical protein
MSSELAVTAVTRTLRQILADQIDDKWGNDVLGGDLTKQLHVTNFAPHKVRDVHPSQNVVNVFLYRTDINAAWRNMPLPSQAKPGEAVSPPLPLNLEYIVTAYGEDDREDAAHFFLAQSMRVLHDTPFIPRAAFQSVLPKARLHQQIENVKVAHKDLSIEETSKLWSVLQTHYRISATYLVTVVLIDSKAGSRSALPVLRRGPDDSGVTAIAGPLPTLDYAKAASGFGAAQLGEDVTLFGERLDMAGVVARVRHPLMGDAIDRPVTPVDAKSANVSLPPASDAGVPGAWPAGIYSITLSGTLPNGVAWATNAVPFALAPAITVSPAQNTNPGPDFEVTIESKPQVREGQQVTAIWGGSQIVPKSIVTPGNDDDPTVVKFDAPGALGIHRVRLRVDGVDSLPMKKVDGKFEFDPDQSVEVKNP